MGMLDRGERAQGLLPPVRHLFTLAPRKFGNRGVSSLLDYLFSDVITSPPELDYLYTGKAIYMPNHFF
jgi:hypothetical protein